MQLKKKSGFIMSLKRACGTLKEKRSIIMFLLCFVICGYIYYVAAPFVTQVFSFGFLGICGELIPTYFVNKKKMLKYRDGFNEDYYDMYISVYTMAERMFSLTFSVVFIALGELLGRSSIDIVIFEMLISFFVVILVLAWFCSWEYNSVICKIIEKRKDEFLGGEFTEEELKILAGEQKAARKKTSAKVLEQKK